MSRNTSDEITIGILAHGNHSSRFPIDPNPGAEAQERPQPPVTIRRCSAISCRKRSASTSSMRAGRRPATARARKPARETFNTLRKRRSEWRGNAALTRPTSPAS